MNRSEWVVLDLGNIIINNDPLMSFIYHLAYEKIHAKNKDISFIDVLEKRSEIYRSNIRNDMYYHILGEYLSKKDIEEFTREYKETVNADLSYYYPFITGSKPFIERLSKRYKLGIIANQPAIIKDYLIKHKYHSYFSFIGLSEDIGLKKPDTAIFKWMLSKTGSDPGDIFYIGDSIYNDILPAHSMNIKPILLRHSVYRKGFTTKSNEEAQYLDHQDRLDNYILEEAKKLEFPLAITLTYEQILYYLNL